MAPVVWPLKFMRLQSLGHAADRPQQKFKQKNKVKNTNPQTKQQQKKHYNTKLSTSITCWTKFSSLDFLFDAAWGQF